MIELHPEVEIRGIPPLDVEEATLLDNHSALNVLNVVVGELTLLGLGLAGKADLFARSLDLCDSVVAGLRNARHPVAWAEAAEALVRSVEGEIAAVTGCHGNRLDHDNVRRGLTTLSQVLAILRIRAQEVLRRHQEPARWGWYDPEDLRRSLGQVLAVMTSHGRDRYGVVYSRAEQGPRDYLVQMDFRRGLRPAIQMPPVLVDVLRDLLANARKYTPPGGTIRARVDATGARLLCEVEDSGRGIPEAELESVVAFGRRGSNVADVRTLGGGFGLTKAFVTTHRFGGRFWIASRLGVGTRVRLSLPLPAGNLN